MTGQKVFLHSKTRGGSGKACTHAHNTLLNCTGGLCPTLVRGASVGDLGGDEGGISTLLLIIIIASSVLVPDPTAIPSSSHISLYAHTHMYAARIYLYGHLHG